MNLSDFKASVSNAAPPEGVSSSLKALWWALKQDWEKAHGIAQDEKTADGSWVHAYLHRVEGDLGNAGYWYSRAGKPAASVSLEAEWDQIVSTLLEKKELMTPVQPNLSDLRKLIDRIDRDLVALLAERVKCLDKVIEVKTRDNLPAAIPERVEQVVVQVREAAVEAGMPPDLAEILWRRLIEWSIAYEDKHMHQP